MDLIERRLRNDDHRAALEAEAGIERLLRDVREMRAAEAHGPVQPGRVRGAVGRALIAVGSAIAARPVTDDPCADGVRGATA